MTVDRESGIRALLGDYFRYAGSRLWLALTLMVLGALAEGVGLLMLVPLVALAAGGDTAGSLGALASLFQGTSQEQRFLVALALFLGAMIARAVLSYARDLQLARLLSGYEASLRARAAATLAIKGWPFASQIGQSGMQSLLLTDVPRAAIAVSQAQQFAAAAAVLLVQLALAASLSARFAGVAVLVLAAGFVASLRLTRRGVQSGIALVKRYEDSADSGFRLHAGLKAALAQGTVPQFLDEYGRTLAEAREESVRSSRDMALSRSLAFLASAFSAAFLFFIGHQLLGLAFPILVASLVLFARLAGPAQQLQQSAHNLAVASPAFASIEARLGKLTAEVASVTAVQPLGWKLLQLHGLAYSHQQGRGLAGISAELKRGEWLGIGGPSGAGKTTLVDLVTGLLVPQQGEFLVDGLPLAPQVLDPWRASLSYVGQDGAIFDDSVRRNLTSDSGSQSDEDLWAALELVGLAERVRSLAGGLDQRVGDRGSALSGGERQRLAIARALLRAPSLLILDEATSALDIPGEDALLQRLRALDPRPAALIVAHRPSTLAHCDSTLVIQHEQAIGAAQAVSQA